MNVASERLFKLAKEHIIAHKPGVVRLPILARGQGTIVTDVDGKSYLDFLSGQVCSIIGHSHPALVEALHEACQRMLHCGVNFQNEDSILLAAELASIMPDGLSKSFLKSAGNEATDAAIHMAKMATDRWEVVSLNTAFHGLTAGPRSSTYTPGTRRGYGPGIPGTFAFPVPDCYRSNSASKKRTPNGWVCEDSVRECLEFGTAMFDMQSRGSPAAIIVEPILSNGGVIEPPLSYLKGLYRFAREREMLFIMDECQTGLGRAGSMLASDDYGFCPDMIALAKSLGGGMPVSSVTTTPAISDILEEKRFNQSASHTNDPFAGLVGMAVLRTLKEEGLIEQARRKGELIKTELHALSSRHTLIGDVRGRGLMIGMEFVRDNDTKEPADTECLQFYEECIDRGLIVNICGTYSNVIRIMPPLTTTDEQISTALAIMDDALSAIKERYSPKPTTHRLERAY